MNIEEIMKPYFDKKEEIEKKLEVNNQYLEEKRIIKLRLERLRDNKEQEIEEYVKNAVEDRPDFYAGYGAMIRKDLEQSYATKELELVSRIDELDEKIENNEKEVQKFHRVDLRELSDVKHDLRKSLFSAKKELELQLQEIKLKLDTVNLQFSTFKYQYDDNHNALNGDELRKLFEQSDLLITERYRIESDLKKIEEYLKETELTQEEIKALMMSMTPWEKEEYDRRKATIEQVENTLNNEIAQNEETQEVIVPTAIDEEVPVVEKENAENEAEEKTEEKTITEVDDIIVEDPEANMIETAKKAMDENTVIEENYSNFLKDVFADITDIAKSSKVHTIELNGEKFLTQNNDEIGDITNSEAIEMPNGIYLRKKDIFKALDKYRKQNKGRVFTVNGKEYEVNRKTVRKLKKALRDCSIIELLREKKLSSFDIKRVYGKEKADEYNNFVRMGTVETKLPSGEYINLADFYTSLKDLFVEKSPSWLERLTSKFKRNNSVYEDDNMGYEDAEYEQLEDELNWTPDEAEYEVVKGKTR